MEIQIDNTKLCMNCDIILQKSTFLKHITAKNQLIIVRERNVKPVKICDLPMNMKTIQILVSLERTKKINYVKLRRCATFVMKLLWKILSKTRKSS